MNALAMMTAIPLLASLSWTASPTPRDVCPLFGPYINNVSGGPVIVDLGSGGSHGQDCDPCSVSGFNVEVTWPAAGPIVVGGLGFLTTGRVNAHETTSHSSLAKWKIECDDEAALSAGITINGTQVISTMSFVCGGCT